MTDAQVVSLIFSLVRQNYYLSPFVTILVYLFFVFFPLAEMMIEEKSRAVLAVMFVLATSLSGGNFSSGSDCGPSTTEANGRAHLLSAVVDAQRAERSQRQHLEALFNR